MKPAAFDYFVPSSVDETLSLLSEFGDDCKILAGGQSLVPFLNFRMLRPACLIDINRIASLAHVRQEPDGALAIGSMTRHATLERLPPAGSTSALFREVMPHVAHLQIRNRGTIGGSLSHADPAAELPAVVAALGCSMELSSSRGVRILGAKEFSIGYLETALQPDELLTRIQVPPMPAGSGFSFVEVSRRHGDFALVGVVAIVTLNPGLRCAAAKLVMTGVGPIPFHADAAVESLVGTSLDEASLRLASQLATDGLEPIGDTHASPAYRLNAARVLALRALKKATERARLEVERRS